MRKTTAIDLVIITMGDKSIEIRTKTIAFDDDETVIGERYATIILKPGDDVTAQPPMIRRLSVVLWT